MPKRLRSASPPRLREMSPLSLPGAGPASSPTRKHAIKNSYDSSRSTSLTCLDRSQLSAKIKRIRSDSPEPRRKVLRASGHGVTATPPSTTAASPGFGMSSPPIDLAVRLFEDNENSQCQLPTKACEACGARLPSEHLRDLHVSEMHHAEAELLRASGEKTVRFCLRCSQHIGISVD